MSGIAYRLTRQQKDSVDRAHGSYNGLKIYSFTN